MSIQPTATDVEHLAQDRNRTNVLMGSAPNLLNPFDICATFPPAASSMPPCP